MAQPLPHHYRVQAEGESRGTVVVRGEGLPDLATDAPPEFGGPPGVWSPETLLTGAIANCYLLSFRAVARASRLDWQSLRVEVEGTLDRVEGVTRFTHFRITACLELPSGGNELLAEGVLRKAKAVCLVTNSLEAQCDLVAELRVIPLPDAAPV